MNTIKTFWDNNHPLSEQAQALSNKLISSYGHCDSLQGELLRAANKISYDWNNNGWGCNNWSGAVRFIQEKFKTLPHQPEQTVVEQLMKELDYVYDYSHGEPHNLKFGGRTCISVAKIQEIIVKAIFANNDLIENTEDMYEYQEREFRHYDEEEDEDGEYH